MRAEPAALVVFMSGGNIMGKLASAKPKAPTSVLKTKKKEAATVTHEGGDGYLRDPRTELFLLAVANMVSENTFYESAADRDSRFVGLIERVAKKDPDWLARFIPYLRNTMNMRSASIVMAAETVHAKLERKITGEYSNRSIIASAIGRADEPAEMIGYWYSRFGRSLPMPLKRGVADAAVGLYNERSVIKHDSGPIRFGDVIDIVHPEPAYPWQSALFRYCLDSRHNRDIPMPWAEDSPYAELAMINGNRSAMGVEPEAFRAMFSTEFVKKNGLTWEQASSRYGKLDAKFWQAMIPTMGIFALVRNLRNFDEAKISPDSMKYVSEQISDHGIIRRSKMFPLRFAAAMHNLSSLHYAQALENAINVSLENVPALPGRSLVLVDVSGSMTASMSAKSTVPRHVTASLFGAALAIRAENADLVAFASSSEKIKLGRAGQSVLVATKAIEGTIHRLGGGTSTWQAVKQHFDGHDRVIIVTDEQSHYGTWNRPEGTKLYTFNVAGYRAGHAPQGRDGSYVFGGLSDAAFTMLPLLDQSEGTAWPF